MDGSHITNRDRKANDERHERGTGFAGEPEGHRQGDVGIKTEGSLYAGFENHRPGTE